MNNAELEIIALIQNNRFLSEELKKRYIVALFLMNDEAQKDYLGLWKAFDERCKKIEKEPFVLESGDMQNVLRSVDEVKRELIKKIQNSHQNQ